MKQGRLEFELIIKLIVGVLLILLILLFALYIPEIFEKIKGFFLRFDLLERFK